MLSLSGFGINAILALSSEWRAYPFTALKDFVIEMVCFLDIKASPRKFT